MRRSQGGGLRDSFLVDGVAFKKTFSYAGFEMQPKAYEVRAAPHRACCALPAAPSGHVMPAGAWRCGVSAGPERGDLREQPCPPSARLPKAPPSCC